MVKQSRQSGFSIVEAVIVVAVIGVIGAAGWLVYQHNRAKPAKADANGSGQTANQDNSQSSSTTPPTATGTVVKVPELSIQITVPSDLKDLSYKVVHSGTFANGASGVDAFFSTTALAALDSKCNTDFGPLGTLTMGRGQYPSDDPTAATDYGGSLVKQFPTFFISYTAPQAACSANSTAASSAGKFLKDFKSAFSTIQALD